MPSATAVTAACGGKRPFCYTSCSRLSIRTLGCATASMAGMRYRTNSEKPRERGQSTRTDWSKTSPCYLSAYGLTPAATLVSPAPRAKRPDAVPGSAGVSPAMPFAVPGAPPGGTSRLHAVAVRRLVVAVLAPVLRPRLPDAWGLRGGDGMWVRCSPARGAGGTPVAAGVSPRKARGVRHRAPGGGGTTSGVPEASGHRHSEGAMRRSVSPLRGSGVGKAARPRADEPVV